VLVLAAFNKYRHEAQSCGDILSGGLQPFFYTHFRWVDFGKVQRLATPTFASSKKNRRKLKQL